MYDFHELEPHQSLALEIQANRELTARLQEISEVIQSCPTTPERVKAINKIRETVEWLKQDTKRLERAIPPDKYKNFWL